ncbi:hypothetical protein BDN72DRAFT_956717 [Pluteus cervinus]|uniref:Uncharacterized protein n=1 Tax=Pluteus cervinus TaxID=181527 RepID=A0ACD3B6P7_9AGAR|nr:hypothetical protein BDN72DRAFT_956717 [Pluteus cervinus]
MTPLGDYSDFFRSGFRVVGARHRKCASEIPTKSAQDASPEASSVRTRSSRRSSIISFSSRLFERVRNVSWVPPRPNQSRVMHSRCPSSDSQSHGYHGDISVLWSENGESLRTPSSSFIIGSSDDTHSLHDDSGPDSVRNRSRPQSLQINSRRQSIDPFASSSDSKSFFIDLTGTPPSPTPLAFYSHFSPPASAPPSRSPSTVPPSPSKLQSFLSLSLPGISPSHTPERRDSFASSIALPPTSTHLQLPPHGQCGNHSRLSLQSLPPIYLLPSPASGTMSSRRSSCQLHLRSSRCSSRGSLSGRELDNYESWFILEEVFRSDSPKSMARDALWDQWVDNKHFEDQLGFDEDHSKLDWRQIHVDLLNDNLAER